MTAPALGLLLALAVAGSASAQSEAPPAGRGRGAPPRNLQVLPKDTAPQDVAALMQQFTRALGVQCTYCHVQNTPPPLTVEEAAAQAAANPPAAGRGRGRGPAGPQMDFAADDKRQKQTARLMVRLVNDLNARIAAIPASSSSARRAAGGEAVARAVRHMPPRRAQSSAVRGTAQPDDDRKG